MIAFTEPVPLAGVFMPEVPIGRGLNDSEMFAGRIINPIRYLKPEPMPRESILVDNLSKVISGVGLLPIFSEKSVDLAWYDTQVAAFCERWQEDMWPKEHEQTLNRFLFLLFGEDQHPYIFHAWKKEGLVHGENVSLFDKRPWYPGRRYLVKPEPQRFLPSYVMRVSS